MSLQDRRSDHWVLTTIMVDIKQILFKSGYQRNFLKYLFIHTAVVQTERIQHTYKKFRVTFSSNSQQVFYVFIKRTSTRSYRTAVHKFKCLLHSFFDSLLFLCSLLFQRPLIISNRSHVTRFTSSNPIAVISLSFLTLFNTMSTSTKFVAIFSKKINMVSLKALI